MAKAKVGNCLPDFIYDTPFSRGISFAVKAAEKEKTALLFLRYAGCTLCQYEIHQLEVNHKSIVGDDGQLLVVLQSNAENMAQQLQSHSLPFDIICDPDQTLYKQFEIMLANSEEDLMSEEEYAALASELEAYQHGQYEGEELQLPAVFIVNKELKLSYVHYGKSIVDIPDVKELEELFK